MRLNPEKCTFGASVEKFLGVYLPNRGIEENSRKCESDIKMETPTRKKEIMKLNMMLMTLNRFILRLSRLILHSKGYRRKKCASSGLQNTNMHSSH